MYDAIIVGARCAGSPTAMLLARQGFKVLLVDRSTFPSDTISTHILWPHGAEILARWGLLGSLAATGAPPMHEFTSQLAPLEPPSPEMRALFSALRGNQDATNAFLSAITGAIPLPDFMSHENVGRIMAAAKDVESHG